ncbi:MAG: diguanylate cyclase domain-containing protein [Eubacteriales bacterium]
MTIIYYSEVNLVCIIILLLFTNQMRFKSDQFSSDNRTLNLLLWTTIIMCSADMVAGICRGQFFSGARLLIEISNLIFYETISAVSFLWMVYVLVKLKITRNYEKELFLWAIPFIIVSIAALTNPFTDFMFTIDENNLYNRNIGVFLHWIVSWFYMIAATAIITFKIIKEPNKKKREKIVSLLCFIIAPAVAAVIQMLFYGVTCSQVGITISIVIISLTEQNNQILTDALTGLGNRYGFNKHWENYLQHHAETNLFLMMIDINNFKQVNDKFGHPAGDRALADVADALKQSCDESSAKLSVCRYGGDEFLIAGCDCQQDEIMALKAQIHKKLEEKNRLENYPYVLSVSMGTSIGICTDSDDIEHLLRMADEAMYDEKKKSKSQKIEAVSKK